MSQRAKATLVEGTVSIASAPEMVYDHLVRVEGLEFLDHLRVEPDRGAMVLVAPDAQGETLLTVLTESSDESGNSARLESVVRSELNRIQRLLDDNQMSAEAGEVGLDAIRDDLEHGAKEAPMSRLGE